MTWFDVAVFALIALSIAFAVIRGALRETGTLVVLAAAGGLAYLLTKPLQALFGAGDSFMATAAIAAGLGIVSFAGLYLGLHLLLSRVELSEDVVRTDRIAGGVFGFLRGLVFVGLGFVAYSYYLGEERRPAAVTHALTLPAVQAIASVFEGFAPPSTRLSPEQEAPSKDDGNAAVEGYDRDERAALSEIVTTVTTSDKPAADKQQDSKKKKDVKKSSDPIADIIKESDPE